MVHLFASDKFLFFGEIFLSVVFFLVFAFVAKPNASSSKVLILSCLSIVLLMLLINQPPTLEELGFRNNFRETFWPWFLVGLLTSAAIFVTKISLKDRLRLSKAYPFNRTFGENIEYLLISGFVQELIARGYFFAISLRFLSIWETVALNIFLFSLAHLFFLLKSKSMIFWYSVIGGAAISVIYGFYPNIVFASLFHSVFGVAVLNFL